MKKKLDNWTNRLNRPSHKALRLSSFYFRFGQIGHAPRKPLLDKAFRKSVSVQFFWYKNNVAPYTSYKSSRSIVVITRPGCLNALTVVRHGADFAFVKLESGTGEDYFGKVPPHLRDNWRWKMERERCIAEARIWVEHNSEQGYLWYEGVFYAFGRGCNPYHNIHDLPHIIRLAYKWLWMQVQQHDLNLKNKHQEIHDW